MMKSTHNIVLWIGIGMLVGLFQHNFQKSLGDVVRGLIRVNMALKPSPSTIQVAFIFKAVFRFEFVFIIQVIFIFKIFLIYEVVLLFEVVIIHKVVFIFEVIFLFEVVFLFEVGSI